MQKTEDGKIDSTAQSEETVSLEKLAQMTGFPAKMIKSELFLGDLAEGEPIPMAELRSHMLGFLNRSLGKHLTDSEAI